MHVTVPLVDSHLLVYMFKTKHKTTKVQPSGSVLSITPGFKTYNLQILKATGERFRIYCFCRKSDTRICWIESEDPSGPPQGPLSKGSSRGNNPAHCTATRAANAKCPVLIPKYYPYRVMTGARLGWEFYLRLSGDWHLDENLKGWGLAEPSAMVSPAQSDLYTIQASVQAVLINSLRGWQQNEHHNVSFSLFLKTYKNTAFFWPDSLAVNKQHTACEFHDPLF